MPSTRPGKLALVGEDDLDALGVLNDVVVGEDDPLRVDDDAGALALPAAAEQVFEEPARAAHLDAHVHQRGEHALDHVGELPGRRPGSAEAVARAGAIALRGVGRRGIGVGRARSAAGRREAEGERGEGCRDKGTHAVSSYGRRLNQRAESEPARTSSTSPPAANQAVTSRFSS